MADHDYLRQVLEQHSKTTVRGNCSWCSVPHPCPIYQEAEQQLWVDAALGPKKATTVKVFDYASERENGDVEIRFKDGSRFDMPVAEWRAIVSAGQSGIITYTTQDDQDLGD